MYDIRPIAIYNTSKQELIGVFAMTSLAIKYLFETPTLRNEQATYYALRNKTKIKSQHFNFPIALRYANDSQIEFLGEENYKILNGYPAALENRMKGFDSTKQTLYKDAQGIMKKRSIEAKNKRFI